jgi:hypothetical protein
MNQLGFFLSLNTKTVGKYTTKLPNGHQIYQMAIDYTNLFHSKDLQNLPKLGFLV